MIKSLQCADPRNRCNSRICNRLLEVQGSKACSKRPVLGKWHGLSQSNFKSELTLWHSLRHRRRSLSGCWVGLLTLGLFGKPLLSPLTSKSQPFKRLSASRSMATKHVPIRDMRCAGTSLQTLPGKRREAWSKVDLLPRGELNPKLANLGRGTHTHTHQTQNTT